MDALEAFVEQRSGVRPEGFVVTGASKRGWTSWLTPVVDARVVATAPIVINTLNFRAQMKHQIETWGEYSEQIDDYTSKGLVRPEGEPRTPQEDHLWRMMDPYTYRAQLQLPKLMIVGANDRYWVLDAMNLYWDELVGPRYVLQAPNAGHSLDGQRELALTTLAVFFRHQAAGDALPELRWTFTDDGDALQLRMQAAPPPVRVRAWTAESETKDFRESQWTSFEVAGMSGDQVVRAPKPAGKHVALFGEYEFEYAGLKYSLTTQAYQH
jgi:PhoPQ-activated pathogenicity-related protein